MKPNIEPNIEPKYWTQYRTQYWAPILNPILSPILNTILNPVLKPNIEPNIKHKYWAQYWQKMNFDKRWPLTEEDLWWKTTFDRMFSILPEKNVYDSSPWQPQHKWSQTGNPIRCLSRKKNFMWWKKCMRHYACTCVQKINKISRQRRQYIHHVLWIVYHASCIMNHALCIIHDAWGRPKNKEDLHIAGRHTTLDIFSSAVFFLEILHTGET